MKQKFLRTALGHFAFFLFSVTCAQSQAQTLAFPEAQGFGRFAKGARAAASPQVYIVKNLNDSGAGSFRDAVSQPGRVVVFAISGIVNLKSDIVVSPNTTIAGQTAPGEGFVLFGKRVTFSSSSNTIARYIRIRLGATDNAGKDASGISNGANMIFDHMTFTWGMDEVFSINWDNKGTSPDNITIQNSIIAQGLHRNNHSAGGLMQPSGGKISLIGNLYSSNKTRNPKVKGINEFVNNVVYNWGNFGNTYGHTQSGEAYIMGGDSEGRSDVNIINNYFIGGPLTSTSTSTPFNRGNANFYLYGSGNYYDNNRDGTLNGNLVPENLTGYPTGDASTILSAPYDYPMKNPALTAQQAFDKVVASVGASYPKRDQVDSLIVAQLNSKGVEGIYLYRETDLPFSNGGVGNVFNAPAPLDTDQDGMPDDWEDAHSLNKNDASDAVTKTLDPEYLNIEVYINGLMNTAPPAFTIPPSNLGYSTSSTEVPPASEVVLTWKDNSNNETGFSIERSSDNINFTEIAQVATDIKTYTDGGLTPNSTYYYRIKALNATESSVYSAVLTVKTNPIPAAPTKTSALSPTDGYQFAELNGANNLELKWSGSTNTTTYSIYFGTDAGALNKLGDVAYNANPSFIASSISAGTTYFWRVDATNNKGTATGDVWSFKTINNIPQGIVGYYAFDETLSDGTQITDSTTYQNHGVLGLDDDDASIRASGKAKNALNFATARTDMFVVSVPNQDQLFLNKSSFSISFWMKADASLLPPDNNSSAYLLCKGSITKNTTTGATGKRFDIEFKNKQIRFAIDDNVTKSELAADATSLFDNNWAHVVVMRDVSVDSLRLFINGRYIKSQSTGATGGIGEVSSLIIGNIGELEFLSNTNAPAPYKGLLDELKIFNYPLSGQQVLEQLAAGPMPLQALAPTPANNGIANGGTKVKASWVGGINTDTYKVYFGTSSGALNLVADLPVGTASYQFTGLSFNTKYFWRIDALGPKGTTTGVEWNFTTGAFDNEIVADWHLDASSGTTITDSSPNALNGSLDNVSSYTWEAGRLNNGLNIKTSTNGAITLADNAKIKFDKTSFSVSFWMKATRPVKTVSVYLMNKGSFSKNDAIGTNGRWYGIEAKNDLLYFSVDDDKNKTSISIDNASFFTNDWVHVVVVRNVGDKKLSIYQNGILAVSGTENATSLANGIGNNDPLYFGNAYGLSAPYTGFFDEIKIFNYALSQEEITKLAAAQSLPVNLTSFTAKAQERGVLLKWTTQSEQNNSYFIIERSTDGQNFEQLKTITGHGTTQAVSNYMMEDGSPVAGINYYRLSQVDFDGNSKILGTQAIKFGFTAGEFLVFPNPIVNSLHIKVPANLQQAKVSLFDSNGQAVFSKQVFSENGLLKVELENKPAPGVYVLSLSGTDFNRTVKVVVR
ncbi:LamG-like jellyroll fold domain-containing protein [Pelobium manganitolerans]|uniref:LamG-like jellyroll fold domain-containing protein n=1 Tax=Pelobium manganitolerans TaxID=1842495 RepID=UPI003FA35725